MKKLILLSLLLLVGLCGCKDDPELEPMPEPSSEGLNYQVLSLEERTVEVVNSKVSGAVLIPETVTIQGETYTVAKIGYEAFKNCKSLTSIKIPNTVSFIGTLAFECCTNLKSIDIPSSVIEMGIRVWLNCDNLGKINVDKNNPMFASKDGVLYDKDLTILIRCPEAIETIDMPATVDSLAGCSFEYCKKLKSIEIGNLITGIPDYTFQKCESLKSVHFGSSVRKIGYRAFGGCENIQSIGIPKTLSEFNPSAFDGCSRLENINIEDGHPKYTSVDGVVYNKTKSELVRFPSGRKRIDIIDSASKIGDDAFTGCNNLESVDVPSHILEIGSWAFGYCENLKTVSLPNSITKIPDGAFGSCSHLISVKIPNTVLSIGVRAFCFCI